MREAERGMDVMVDPASPDPIYEQIRSGLTEAILRGDLAPGQTLPSIRALARDLRVSVITTTRAYNELVADGLVVSRQGRGVFVREQDADALRGRAVERIREDLAAAVRSARLGGIGDAELHRLLDGELAQEEGER